MANPNAPKMDKGQDLPPSYFESVGMAGGAPPPPPPGFVAAGPGGHPPTGMDGLKNEFFVFKNET